MAWLPWIKNFGVLVSRKAVSQMQAVAIVIIVLTAVIGTIYYIALPVPVPFLMQVIEDYFNFQALKKPLSNFYCPFQALIQLSKNKGQVSILIFF